MTETVTSFEEATRESAVVELEDGAETAADESAEQLPRETGDDTSAGSADDVVVAPVDAPVAPETGVEDADQAG